MNEKKKTLKPERKCLKMLLAEADEQTSRTCGQNGHGNVEDLLSGKTL